MNITINVTEERLMNGIGQTSKNYGPGARIFDEGCIGWTEDADYDTMFIKMQERYFNDLLENKKFVFLNEVYSAFGFPWTKTGQLVGWIYDEDDPNHGISIGIYKECDDSSNQFVLTFNVDGIIIDKI